MELQQIKSNVQREARRARAPTGSSPRSPGEVRRRCEGEGVEAEHAAGRREARCGGRRGERRKGAAAESRGGAVRVQACGSAEGPEDGGGRGDQGRADTQGLTDIQTSGHTVTSFFLGSTSKVPVLTPRLNFRCTPYKILDHNYHMSQTN